MIATAGVHTTANWPLVGTVNTDTLIATGVAMLVVLTLSLLVARKSSSGVPSKIQLVYEGLVQATRNAVRSSIHFEGAEFVVPLALALGLFILISNWLEMIPTNDNLISPTSDLNLTFAMGVVVIVLVQIYAFQAQGFKGYFRRFTKPFELPLAMRIGFIPLNIIEEVVKPVTLALRLMGNIFAGAVMLLLISKLPIAVLWLPNILWKAFDMGIGLLQAFIFAFLTIFYFGMAREGMEGHH